MNEKLNGYHITILIFMTQSGIVLFSLPRLLAEYFGTNGWIGLLPCSAAVFFHIYLISLVYRWGQARSPFDILEQSIPKMVLIPFYLVWAAVMTTLGSAVTKQYILLFQLITFPTTSPVVFKLICDLLVFLMLLKGIYNISKASTIFFYLAYWILFLHVYYIDEFRFVRLTTFFFQGGTHPFSGWLDVYLGFLGYELCLFLFPYVSKHAKFFRAVHRGNLLLTITYLIVCFICFGFFGYQQVRTIMYPFVNLLAYIELPFVERIESLLFPLFIFKILITALMYAWAAVELLIRIFPRGDYRKLCLYVVLGSFLISYFPQVLREADLWVRTLGYAQFFASFAFTLLLLFLSFLKKVFHKEETPDA